MLVLPSGTRRCRPATPPCRRSAALAAWSLPLIDAAFDQKPR
jgi:hypothetical protein